MRWHVWGGIIADWAQALNGSVAIALIWTGQPFTRWEMTAWIGALILAVIQLQCYRRWLESARTERDKYRDELRIYHRSWGPRP